MIRLLHALLALALAAPLSAQTVRVTPTLNPGLGTPALGGLTTPILSGPSSLSPASLAPSLIPSLAAPSAVPSLQAIADPISLGSYDQTLTVSAVPAASDLPGPRVPGAKTPVKAATPADGWAKRFNFTGDRQFFDGSKPIRDELGNVFQAVPKDDGKVRVHIVERAPKATPKAVPGTEGLSGKNLLDALSAVAARNAKTHEYKEASRFIFSKADQVVINGVKGVVDAYSGIFVPGTSENGGDYSETGDPNGDGFPDKAGMNIEHTWPQSLFGKALPMRSDVHHLMATFMHPNSVRGAMPFGEVKGQADYENKAGAKRGGGVFEPPDAVKGRVARGLLYYYSRYKDSRQFGRTSTVFWNQQIELMMKWNRQFPPDAFEARRNDLVEQWQGNRNPFIDDYTLADRVGAEAFRSAGPSSGGRGFRASGRSASRR